jgi:hypothetical protein
MGELVRFVAIFATDAAVTFLREARLRAFYWGLWPHVFR